MTRSCEALEDALGNLGHRYGWRCRPVPGRDRVLIATGRRRADSEPVTLHARVDEESLIVSDGGETLALLADVGLDRDDPVMEGLWQEALRTYRLSESDGRVFLAAPLHQAADTLNRLADGLVALDGLRVAALPARRRQRTLADQVEDYLREVYPPPGRVERKPQVQARGGLVLRPALVVGTSRGGVLVQPGSASSPTQSYDHAFTLFAQVSRRTDVGMPRRLAVLSGTPASWGAARLRALGELTFVGFWSDRARVRRFLDGDVPDDPVLVPPGFDVPMFA